MNNQRIASEFVRTVGLIAALGCSSALGQRGSATAEEKVVELLRADQPVTTVSAEIFDQLGWDVPDGGRHVKALADAAPGGAFDPEDLERLPGEVGYKATWIPHRFEKYGQEWDITGLYLEPNDPIPGLPTYVQIHGGSGNFYQFFVMPHNEAGFGQYLAQKIPVLLVTIPGNYKPGGWDIPPGERRPQYLLDQDLSVEETQARNAMFTFVLICEGVAQLVEKATKGPILISGHSTGGEIQFMLRERLEHRLRNLSLGWGTGGPARLRRIWADEMAAGYNRTRNSPYLPITEVRERVVTGWVHGYVGPFNGYYEDQTDDIYTWYFRVISDPDLMLNIAKKIFEGEGRRKPFFKQHLQDLEHTGQSQHREEAEKSIRDIAKKTGMPENPNEVIKDLLATTRTGLEGYRRMLWTTSTLDEGHWDPDPKQARELFIANQFRKANPNAQIRVLLYDTLLTHIGYMERAKQLAGGTLASIRWLYEEK